MIAFFLDCAFKSSIVLIVAFAATAVLRNRSASLRHSVWSAALLTIIVLPALIVAVPGTRTEMNVSTVTRLSPPVELSQPVNEPAEADAAPGISEESFSSSSAVDDAVLWVWIFGWTIVVLYFIAEAFHLGRVAYASQPFFNSRWFRMTKELSRKFDLKRPVRFAQNKTNSMLVTWGIFRPRVLLPCGADDWSDHRICAVLGHELAHVRRHDWFFQLAGEIARSIYWFNPLVWFACNRLRQESERACDDAALGLGMDCTEYAAELLELARLLKTASCSWASSLAMARPSTLERRFAAMLNPRLDRRSLSRKTAVAVGLCALYVTLSVAAIQSPVQNQTGRLFGRVYDPSGAPIKNAAITIYNSASRFKAVSTSSASGVFEFTRVPAGNYELQTSATGFEVFQIHAVVIEPNQEVNLNIMTVAAAAPAPAAPVKQAAATPAATPPSETKREVKPVPKPESLVPTVVPPAEQQSQASKTEEQQPARIRLGGNVASANLIYQAKPIYPDAAKEARISGVVVLEIVIGMDGAVQSTNVLSGHPYFVQPAIEAVSQWRYTPTLLNGQPVEVLTTVTLNFSLGQ